MSHITRQNIGGQRYDVANIGGREYRNKIDSPLKSAAIGTGIALAAGAGTIGAYSALNKYVGDTSWVDDAARTHGDYNVHTNEYIPPEKVDWEQLHRAKEDGEYYRDHVKDSWGTWTPAQSDKDESEFNENINNKKETKMSLNNLILDALSKQVGTISEARAPLNSQASVQSKGIHPLALHAHLVNFVKAHPKVTMALGGAAGALYAVDKHLENQYNADQAGAQEYRDNIADYNKNFAPVRNDEQFHYYNTDGHIRSQDPASYRNPWEGGGRVDEPGIEDDKANY